MTCSRPEGDRLTHARPLITIGIPLYRSDRFVDNVLACIAAMPQTGVEIIVSDRHQVDDALRRIATATAGDSRVRCLAANDALDWVRHINLLMSMARGTYWRLMPHDDFVPAGSLEALLQVMETDPQLLVAYGATRAEDLTGRHLPDLDVKTARPSPDGSWTYGHFLDLHFNGYFSGAFKGLVRLDPIRERSLYIRPNVDLVDSERLWVFGLATVGRIQFVPGSIYVKRYHPASTHRQWRRRSVHHIGALRLMVGYLRDVHPQDDERRLAEHYLAWKTSQQLALPELLVSPRVERVPLIGRVLHHHGRMLLALRGQRYLCPLDSSEPLLKARISDQQAMGALDDE